MLPKLPWAKLSILVSFCTFFLLGTTPASAANIGTHLGEGDISFQVKIMDTLSANGAGSGFPVTVMVSTTSPLSDLQTLSAGVTRNGFFPIVRINDVCKGADAARIVRDVKTAFGNDIPIEYGNEVNNQDVECTTSYANYASEYSQVRGLSNVGPAALDWYNSIFPAERFLDSISKSNYSGNVYFANAYGCIGQTADTCDVAGTDTHLDGYNRVPGNPIYLTEFSLSPGGDSNAPDTDLKKVVEFIQTRAPEDVKAITPLIRNVCNDDGDWLLYVNGKVLTRNGAVIDPATCSADESATAPFYLYQIESLKEALQQKLPAKAAAGDIAEELINQGYEVSCTAPEGLFRTSLENWADYEKYVDPSLQSLPTKLFGFTQEVDYTDVKYPLFRKGALATSTNDSIEAHFGYLQTDENLEEIGRETKSASLYKLLSSKQQCQQQKDILATINAMCGKLEDPDSCALYQDIPQSEYTTKSLYPISQNLNCEPQAKSEAIENDKSGVIAAQYEALQNTPLYLDKAYRLGFIVFSAQQRGSLENNPGNGWDFLFHREENPEAKPENEVRIVAFKLPDIGTNKDINSDIYYDDPLIITRDILTSRDDQKQRQKTLIEQQEEFKKGAEFASKLDFPSSEALINCSGPVCDDPLGRALVNLVNSGTDNFDRTCQLDERTRQQQLIRFEKSNKIQVAGRLNEEAAQEEPNSASNGLGTFFRDSFQALTNIFRQPEEAAQSPQAFDLIGTAGINPDQYVHGAFIPEAKFNTFLIYPVGYELQQVVDTLAGTIKDAEQVAELNTNPDYDPYFMLSGINQDFTSDVESHTYTLAPGQGDCNIENEIDIETGLPKGCEKKIEYKALGYLNDNDGDENSDNIDFEPRIRGGLLGGIMRDIQLSLRKVSTNSWHYINSCKTTEDFLLGRCSKTAAKDAITTDGIAGGSCSELYGSSGKNPTMTVYDREKTFGHVLAAAKRSSISADEQIRFAQTLWGVLEIEGSPYLRVMRTVPDGQTATISCSQTINSCGAVGPLQIIQGACVTESCSFSNTDLLRKFDRPENLCDIATALDWTASNLLSKYDAQITDIDARHAAMAGAHPGLGSCDTPATSQGIEGCGPPEGPLMNYCDCASTGFENRFNEMLRAYE